MEDKIKLLMVDDEALLCEIMGSHFKRRGYEVFTATSGKQAIDLAKAINPQIMLLDKRMPGMDGIETLEVIRQFNQSVKAIFVSGDTLDQETEGRIKGLNVTAYMHKPLVIADLDAAVEKAVLLSQFNNDFEKASGRSNEEATQNVPAQEPLGCVL